MGIDTVRAFGRSVAFLIAVCVPGLFPSLLHAQSSLEVFVREVLSRPHTHCATEAALEVSRAHRIKGDRMILTTPQLQDSIVSASGRFKVFYDHTGANVATPEYAAFVAAIADTAYMLEVDTLGYPKPAYGFPDSTWHIYLMALGSAYGMTATTDDGSLGNSPTGLLRSRSYITIDHSFSDDKYPTKGLDAARITIFHEFHHVIQFADYGSSPTGSDLNFREMTSTWMEMRSSPWIPDYTQYLPSYIADLDQAFPQADVQGGYGQSIWMQYVAGNLGDSLVREFWTWFANKRAEYLPTMDTVLKQHGTSFCELYGKFGGDLVGLQYRYEHQPSLPIDQTSLEKLRVGSFDSTKLGAYINPASLLLFRAPSNPYGDVLVLSAAPYYATVLDYQLHLTASGYSSTQADKICSRWESLPQVGVTAYPQPFVISDPATDRLSILASIATVHDDGTMSRPASCQLNIHDLDNRLIRYSEPTPELTAGKWFVRWDGTDDHGRVVSSGIYTYALRTDGSVTSGKIVVVRK
ncbi:MAG: hypothetical protein JSS75_06885 [Bacteroidetes bacterium]|nr:hypothetical protein [Bacteroidota bacterium]